MSLKLANLAFYVAVKKIYKYFFLPFFRCLIGYMPFQKIKVSYPSNFFCFWPPSGTPWTHLWIQNTSYAICLYWTIFWRPTDHIKVNTFEQGLWKICSLVKMLLLVPWVQMGFSLWRLPDFYFLTALETLTKGFYLHHSELW